MDFPVDIHPDGKVTFLGIDEPDGTLVAHHRGTNHIVVKIPGHTVFAGRGEPRRRVGVSYWVLVLGEPTIPRYAGGKRRFRVTDVVAFDLNAKDVTPADLAAGILKG